MIKVAVLDDYQNAFEEVVDTEKLKKRIYFNYLDCSYQYSEWEQLFQMQIFKK